jgi:hypothetical protein
METGPDVSPRRGRGGELFSALNYTRKKGKRERERERERETEAKKKEGGKKSTIYIGQFRSRRAARRHEIIGKISAR